MMPVDTGARLSGTLLQRLDRAAVAALVGGSAASGGLMLYAAQRVQSPRLLLVLFVGWVLSPFAVLAAALLFSKRWAVATRAALYIGIVSVAAISVGIYGTAALGARRPPTAPFVLTAPASCAVLALGVAAVALMSRPSRHAADRQR